MDKTPRTFRAPAKLNLFLEVLGRRPDGYHELDSIFCEIDLADEVQIALSRDISLELTGPEAEGIPTHAGNLAWRAAESLGVGARIRIHKRIPAGGGLGGGSSDAATVLRALNEMAGLGHDLERLSDIGQSLGADVPFFLRGGTAHCRGIGEIVEPLPSPGPRRYLLVLPKLNSSTPAVFAAHPPGLTENPHKATVFWTKYRVAEGAGEGFCFNRLQAAAERVDPRLRAVREDAERRFGRRFTLTGSGAAYFAELGEGSLEDPIPEWTVAGVPVRALLVRSQ